MFVQPYLCFEGRCEEAINFYKHTLGAEVGMLMRFSESPDTDSCDAPNDNKVMHAAIRIGDTMLLATDGECSGNANFHGISLSLTVGSEREAEQTFNGLADGGKITCPLETTFFAKRFGVVQDKFGIEWTVMLPN
jgi:PhnB protein